MRRLHPFVASLMICACLPTTTHATESAKLHATFHPERLGAETTIEFTIQITAPTNAIPRHFPANSFQHPAKDTLMSKYPSSPASPTDPMSP